MVTFKGTVVETKSGNPMPGVPVKINVSKPDGSVEPLLATTVSDGSFTTDYDAAPGTYSAVAAYAGDATHKAAMSPAVSFDVAELLDVTITLIVNT